MRRYKMVIIDEATQATEPSNIIPLVRTHASHVLWPVLDACFACSCPSDWPRRRIIPLMPGAVMRSAVPDRHCTMLPRLCIVRSAAGCRVFGDARTFKSVICS